LKKALSQDGAFLVARRFQFTQKRKGMKNGPPERNEGVLLSIARRVQRICIPLLPL